MPTDLDANLHMTNGRYLSIADLGRIDLAMRSGLWRTVLRNKWSPIVTTATTIFRRELRFWQRFRLTTEIAFWNDRIQVMRHTFRFHGGGRDGEVAAITLAAAAFYDRNAKAFVPMEALLAAVGSDDVSPDPTPEITAFVAQIDALRDTARA